MMRKMIRLIKFILSLMNIWMGEGVKQEKRKRVDSMQKGKFNGKWLIINVVWGFLLKKKKKKN